MRDGFQAASLFYTLLKADLSGGNVQFEKTLV